MIALHGGSSTINNDALRSALAELTAKVGDRLISFAIEDTTQEQEESLSPSIFTEKGHRGLHTFDCIWPAVLLLYTRVEGSRRSTGRMKYIQTPIEVSQSNGLRFTN